MRPSKKLFKEFNPEGIYSIEDWHDTFVELCDPTEYRAAIKLAGSWAEWERFKREWRYFGNVILQEWLEEVEVKIRSQSVLELIKRVPEDASSAKFLAEGKYKEKIAGKPSKKRLEREKNVQLRVSNKVDPEVERVLNFEDYKATL